MTGPAPAGERFAAIDCGTNSTRLLVAEADGAGGFTTLERRMVITRLGQGVDGNGSLHPDAIDRTLGVLRDYRGVMDGFGVAAEHVRMAATSAARDAADRDAFFGPAAEAVGVEPELLSGGEEGALSFRGATTGLDPSLGPFVVLDIGGGSTELSTAEGAVSVDIGCVRLTELYVHGDPPEPEELHACIAVTTEHLKDVERELPAVSAARTFVGVAGTISTVAAVEIGLPAYDRDAIHHFRLTREAAEDVFRTLATEARADRVHNPGLEEARADVIVAGCCILVSVFRHFGLDELLVSEADILDGLVLSLVAPGR